MAIYNEILAGRFAKSLVKLFNMKGENPAKQLSGEIMAVRPFFAGAEDRILESWQRYAGAFSVGAGGAGNVGILQLFNPLGSGVAAVVEKIAFGGQIAAAQAALVNYSNSGAQLAGQLAISNIGLDNRFWPTPTLQLQSKNNTATAPGGITIWNGAQLANSVIDVIVTDIQEIPLMPNSALIFSPTTANLAFAVNLMWRERPLEASELLP